MCVCVCPMSWSFLSPSVARARAKRLQKETILSSLYPPEWIETRGPLINRKDDEVATSEKKVIKYNDELSLVPGGRDLYKSGIKIMQAKRINAVCMKLFFFCFFSRSTLLISIHLIFRYSSFDLNYFFMFSLLNFIGNCVCL